jgi:carboxypeptidase T
VVKHLVDSREIYIAPVVNPDGYVYDYTDGTSGRMWRKNRRPNGNGTAGVDLNRNYGFQWGTTGISRSPGSDTYLGPSPFSEVESTNVKGFVDSQPRMTTLVTYHSFAEQILYPWSYSNESIPETHPQWAGDLEIFKKMGSDMSKWTGYISQQSSELYPSSGDTSDWAYAAHRIYAFTIELSPNSEFEGGFYPDPAIISKTFAKNLNPMLYLTEYANDPSRVLKESIPEFAETATKMGVPVADFRDLELKN